MEKMKRYKSVIEGLQIYKSIFKEEGEQYTGGNDPELVCPNCGESNYSLLNDNIVHCNNCGTEETVEEFKKAKSTGQQQITVDKTEK
jgi:anaerobic ribonucleoside-triphosphate reductase